VVAGGLLAAPVMRRNQRARADRGRPRACAAASLLLTTASVPVTGIAAVALGLCIVWINVGAITLIQHRTPPALLGRVDAALEFAIVVPQAASIALGGALIAVVDYRILLLAMAAVIGTAAGYLASRRGRRDGEIAAMALQQGDSMPR
jgi:hypothetical protein